MRTIAVTIVTLVAALALPPAAAAARLEAVPSARQQFRVLLFTRTTGFRHESIPAGRAAIKRLGRRHGFGVNVTG
jgi:hypothetical protein